MAANREDFNVLNSLLEDVNKKLIEIGKNAEKTSEQFANPKTLKELKQLEKAIDDLEESTKVLNDSKKLSGKINEEQTKSLTEQEKLQKRLTKAKSEEGQALAKLRVELTKVNKENRENAKELLTQRDAYEELVKNTNETQKNFKRLAAEYGTNSKEAKDARKEFEKFDNELRQINDDAKDGRRDVGRYRQEVSKLADELKGAANDAGGFGDILSKVTSPVGIATTIVGGLGSAFASTQEGGDKLKDGLAGLKGGFNAVIGSTGGFINSLIEGNSISEAYAQNLENVTDKIKEQSAANVEATQLSRQNRRDLRFESEALARLRGEYELLQQQSGDATTTLEKQNEATIQAQQKAVEIAEQELVVLAKQIEAVDLQIQARKGLNNEDLLDERQELANQQIEIEGTLNAELAALGQERRQIEQDQWEQRLDFLFDASDRQKSITERQLQDESVSTKRRVEQFEFLRDSIVKTYSEIEAEFRRASGQQINIVEIANMEATEQAKLLKTLNLSEIERNRLREAVVEYLAVVQDLEETNKDLLDVEQKSLELQKEIELQRIKLIDESFDLEGALTEFKKEQLREQISDLEAYSIERLEKEKELNNLLLKERERYKSDLDKLVEETSEEEDIDNLDALRKKIEDDKKAAEEQKKIQQDLSNAVFNILEDSEKRRSERKQKALDEEEDGLKEQQSKLEDLAAKGDENAVKSLQLASKREAEIQRERERELQRAQRNEIILAGIKTFANNQDAPKTLSEVAALVAGLSEIGIPSAFDGVDDTGGRGDFDSKGGKLWNLHPKEQVHSLQDRKDMADPNTGKLRTRQELKDIVNAYDNGLKLDSNIMRNYAIEQKPYESNKDLLNRVDNLEIAIKSLPKEIGKNMPTNNAMFDEFIKAFRYTSKQGNRTTKTNYFFD